MLTHQSGTEPAPIWYLAQQAAPAQDDVQKVEEKEKESWHERASYSINVVRR